jgi:hypothetical protein
MFMLNHETTYVIYALYIQRIINYMEFGYDEKHGAYLPHVVWGSAVPPPSPTAATVGTSVAAPTSSPIRAPSPPAVKRHVPLAASESSRATTHQDSKQNILILDLKTFISICRSHHLISDLKTHLISDLKTFISICRSHHPLIRKSHQILS